MLPHRVVELTHPADAPRLQRLLEKCSDYYELHEGWPTPPDAGEYELTAVPSTRTPQDLCMLAFEDADGTLHAMAQVLRNYPDDRTWWIGLLVVAPEWRSRGIGSALLRHTIDAAAAAGATAIQLIVSPRNPRGQAFWETAGFRDTGESYEITARSGHTDTARLLSRALTPAPA